MKEIFTKAVAHFITLIDDVDAITLSAKSDEELAHIVRRSKDAEDEFTFQVNPDLIVREIGDQWLLVSTGDFAQHFNGMISPNVFRHFVWQQFEQPNSLGAVLRAAHGEFDDPHHMMDIQVRHLVQEYALMGCLDD